MSVTRIDDRGRGNQVEVADDAQGELEIAVHGNGNRIVIGRGCRFPKFRIEIRGDDCVLEIGPRCVLKGYFIFRTNLARVTIGAATTTMSQRLTMHEPGEIRVGEDCMFADEVSMDCSDMHSIIDVASGNRINPPADIVIGDHVWVGYGVYLMKGVRVGSHSVIGARSVVTNNVPAHCVAAGNPARVVRTGVTWDRRRLPWPAGADGT